MHPAQCPAEPPVHEVADDHAVEFLLNQPGLVDVLIGEHVDDGTGDCAACPGPQSGRRRWPCNVRLLAARAEHVRAARALQHNATPGRPAASGAGRTGFSPSGD